MFLDCNIKVFFLKPELCLWILWNRVDKTKFRGCIPPAKTFPQASHLNVVTMCQHIRSWPFQSIK